MTLSFSPVDALTALAESADRELPVAVRLIDVGGLTDGMRLPASRSGAPYRRLLGLVSRAGQPLGWRLLRVSDGVVCRDALAELSEALTSLNGASSEATTHTHERRDPCSRALLSIVVSTCAKVEPTIRCVEAIRACGDPAHEVIVVENRPRGSTVSDALRERYDGDPRVRYLEEGAPGLANARNAGLRAARGELVAFTDDDVIVDARWLQALRGSFASMPMVDCVTGLIAPLELETAAQVLIERFASYGKGLVPRVYSLERPPSDQPLFPYTAGHFGSGANMAFRTNALRELGSFDPVLGTGTPARGCEDLDICIRLLNAGGEIAYEPRAIVWHRHPDTDAGLRQRAFDYGAALGALASKHLLVGPNRWAIVSRVPKGIRYLTDPTSRKNASRGGTFPRRLVWLERAGLLCGPVAYIQSRARALR